MISGYKLHILLWTLSLNNLGIQRKNLEVDAPGKVEPRCEHLLISFDLVDILPKVAAPVCDPLTWQMKVLLKSGLLGYQTSLKK